MAIHIFFNLPNIESRMPSSPINYTSDESDLPTPILMEEDVESTFIQNLKDLGYTYRTDIRDRKTLEDNFR